MLHVFIGYDHRQPISYAVAHHSLITRCSVPVTVTPLRLDTLPISAQGLTPFTHTRWLVPWLMENDGYALFLDADVLVLGDVAEILEAAEQRIAKPHAVWVVKNQRTFEWPSVMLFDCSNPALRALTPEFVDTGKAPKWDWLDHDLIGALPSEWNHLVGYDTPRNDAKLVHFTAGIPAFPETQMSEYAEAWHQEAQSMMSAVPWEQLMGNSVHATRLPNGKVLPHFHPEVQQASQAPVNPVDLALKAG